KIQPRLFPFLDKLDRIVLDHGGRLYLAKDVRMSEQTFKQSYPKWTELHRLRRRLNLTTTFNSLQSKRLGV
ncbi:MAG: FAD-binding protein, partial [Deltaproteobacteria bacterium]|nr:FAD-binding protein [Deltaproteobacteria bacterium]